MSGPAISGTTIRLSIGFAVAFVLAILFDGDGVASSDAAANTTPVVASPAEALAAVCAKVPCRKNVKEIKLRMQDGTFFTTTTQLYPYADDEGAVIVFPGETIVVALPRNGDAFGKPQVLRVIDADGSRELRETTDPIASLSTIMSFELKQDEGRPGMTLTVLNKINSTIKYDAYMYVPTSGGIESARTSACPLFPPAPSVGSFYGIENWPHPIVMIVITNIRALPKDNPSLNCE